MSVELYTPKEIVLVEAMQFLGWQNLEKLQKWLPGSFFVPRGYEHYLRTGGEKDRSRGDVLDDAPSYLVTHQKDRADTPIRVDERMWIVKDKNGTLMFYDHSSFIRIYQLYPSDLIES